MSLVVESARVSFMGFAWDVTVDADADEDNEVQDGCIS
jgi:hypothetical protein